MQASIAVLHMSRSPHLNGLCDGRQVSIQLLFFVLLLTGFVLDSMHTYNLKKRVNERRKDLKKNKFNAMRDASFPFL